MVVTPRHNNIQADGKVVCFQPLDGWNNVSNLVDLVSALSAMFARMPPCQAKPAGYGAQQVTTIQSEVNNSRRNGYNTYSSVYGGTYGAAQNSTYGGNNKPPPTYDSQPPSYGNEAQAYGIKNNVNSNQNAYNQSQVRNAQASGTITGHRTNGSKNERAKLEERVKREAEIVLQARRSALNSALDNMEALDAGQRKLKVGLNTLKEQENTLKGYIQVTKSKNANIAQWLVENENKNKKDVDPDEVISSGDVWSEQIFDQVATISAIDDTLFELDEGLKRGVVDLKPFLRSVRNLASQQFRAKALAMKICDLQSQMMLARHSSRKSSGGHFGGKTNSGGMFSSNNGQNAYTGYK